LGRGFLSGRYGRTTDLPDGDWRRRSPRFGPDAIETNRALLAPLQDAAALLGVTPAQVALAWVLAQGEHVVAIPGTKNPGYLRENLAAASLHLPADVLVMLDALPEPVGARY
jgi:aryl-alcohol dehydrogenase-like predicted oxidoreductase